MNSQPPAEKFFDGQDLALGKAIEAGDVSAVRESLAGLELSLPRGDDMTFLFFAIIHGRDAVVAELIRAGADPRIVVPDLGSPLGIAVRSQDSRWLNVFLDSGVSPNATDEFDLPVLFAATESPNTTTLKTLHEHGADLDATNSLEATAMYEALCGQKFDHVEYLIGAGANVQFSTMNGATMGNALERQLGRVKPNTRLAGRLERIKELLQRRGFVFPAEPIDVVRRKRMEANLKVAN